MNPSITFRHDFTQADLEAMLPRLREVFSQVGMDFDACMAEGMIGFERATTGFTLQIEELALKFRTAADDAKLFAGCTLRETAWERRNTNAPWWRQFQSKQRRHA